MYPRQFWKLKSKIKVSVSLWFLLRPLLQVEKEPSSSMGFYMTFYVRSPWCLSMCFNPLLYGYQPIPLLEPTLSSHFKSLIDNYLLKGLYVQNIWPHSVVLMFRLQHLVLEEGENNLVQYIQWTKFYKNLHI